MFLSFDISCVTFVQKLKANIWTDCIMKVGSRVSSDAWNGDDQGFLYWLNWFIGKTNCSPGIQGLFQDLVEIPRNTCSNSGGVLWCDQVEELMIEYRSGLKMFSPIFEPGVVVVRFYNYLLYLIIFLSSDFRNWTQCNFCHLSGFRLRFQFALSQRNLRERFLPLRWDWNWSNTKMICQQTSSLLRWISIHIKWWLVTLWITAITCKVINIVPLKCFPHTKSCFNGDDIVACLTGRAKSNVVKLGVRATLIKCHTTAEDIVKCPTKLTHVLFV